jgi:sirohydrochlorin cobaltochelatase
MGNVDREALDRLNSRIRTLLPELYQDSFETLEPVPMRSAGLKFGPDGRVAWDEMWGSFCDLALAGGPPHKGALLGPGLDADIDADFDRYDEAGEEICRGIRLVTGLRAYVSPDPGWVRVSCPGDAMAGWLLRAITTENVAARRHGAMLDLPAAPQFRLEKEIKNVITVMAKTCHYWIGHMPRPRQEEIGDLLLTMERESPLIEPSFEAGQAGWTGVACDDVSSAVWMMRALVASNVLARREATVLCVPVNPAADPDGRRVAAAVERVREARAFNGPR